MHIHFPAGGVEKDGPSAGITIMVALVSLFCNKLLMPGVLSLCLRLLYMFLIDFIKGWP